MEKMPASLNLRRAWRWWIIPASLALALALLYLDPFVGDWDALDYTVLAVRGQPSSMALGRSAFIFTNHALWRIAHALFEVPVRDAYLLFKGAVVIESALAVIACWALAHEVTSSRRMATVAALAIALSPGYVIYSGQVMTEIPSLLVLTVALTLYLRGVRERRVWMMLAGAILLGADVNVRETVGFYAPWLVVAPLACGWKMRRREITLVAVALALFLLFALGPFAVWFWTDAGSFRASWYGWRETMREEAARHPLSIGNALPFLIYFAVTAPLVFIALPVAFFKEWREHKLSTLLGLAAVGLFANFLLLFNYSTTINLRYFLTGLPALAPLAASYFMRAFTKSSGSERRAFTYSIASLALVALLTGLALAPLRTRVVAKHAMMKDYLARLRLLPRDAVVMAGGQTVSATFWRGAGEGEWDVIGTGSGWPGVRLVPVIETYLKDGRRVFLETDPAVWSPCGWQKVETIALSGLERHFRFRRISDTIYEIRPVTDESAQDAPHLQGLLPENRPEDTRICLRLGNSS